jgi:hypothetical protein
MKKKMDDLTLPVTVLIRANKLIQIINSVGCHWSFKDRLRPTEVRTAEDGLRSSILQSTPTSNRDKNE